MVSVTIGRLPTTSGKLFGRDDELRWLDDCWQDGVRVASVVAWGGVGKTALVNQWLREVSVPEWRGAARVFAWSFYSQGTERVSADAFVEAALKWFGDADPNVGSPWDKGERLAQLVRKERTLLVVDGVEPLQEGPEGELGRFQDRAFQTLVKELGAENPGLCLLTTRVPLVDVEAEDGTRVRELKLERLSAEAGAQLLADRGAKGDEAELRAAVDEYEGHAFALQLLAGYLRKRYKGDVAMRRHMPVLEGKPATRMMGMYEKWFARKPEMAVLRMLGLFDRPATKGEVEVLRARPAIPGITKFLKDYREPAWNELVTRLRDVGLVAAEGESDKLDAHPLVREYFGEQLKREVPEGWREGNGRLYEYLKGKARDYPETIEGMVPLYQAVVHGCRAGKSAEALDEVYKQRIQRRNEGFGLHKLGAFASAAASLSAFFDPPWERPTPDLDRVDQAWILNEAGFVLLALARFPDAQALLRAALSSAIALRDWRNAAQGASNLSDLARSRGELLEAEGITQNGIKYADVSGDRFQQAATRATLAATMHALGRLQGAAASFKEAEQLWRIQFPSSPFLSSLAGFQYCDLLLEQGQAHEARQRAARALDIALEKKWVLFAALDRLSLGRAYLLIARPAPASPAEPPDLQQARDHLQQALAGLRSGGRQDHLPLGLLARADLRIHEHHLTDARRDLTEALTLSTRCGFRLHECDARLGFARLALAEHKPADALDHLARARAIIDETSYHRRDAELAELTAEADAMAKVAASLPAPSPEIITPVAEAPHESPPTMPTDTDPTFDVVIVCAVPDTELARVRRTGAAGWTGFPACADDPSTYYETVYAAKGGRALRVIAGAPTQMGMPASAVLATKMIRRFKPRLVAMVGIAAGARRDRQAFGDVLAADRTFDYNAGKLTVREGKLHFEPDFAPLPISERMKSRLHDWASSKDKRAFLNAIADDWEIPAQSTRINIHIGPLGSGAAVIDDKQPMLEVVEHWRKLIGIEMEAYGVHLACQNAREPRPEFLCLKAISDFAAEKTDDRRDYAAFTAAQLCHAFITEEWGAIFPDPR